MKKFLLVLTCLLSVLVFATGCDEKEDAKTYNVIMTSATIPPMIAIMDTIESENETIAWIGRQNTINSVANLKSAYKKITFIESWSTASNIPNAVVNSMNEYVSDKWFGSDEKANFNIYVTDYGVVAALYLVESNGIPTTNYKIHLIEDGSGAYNQFLLSSGDNQGYKEANGNIKFQANLAELNGIVDSMRAGTYVLPESAYQSYNLSYVATTLPSIDYYLQFPNLLSSENAEIQAMLTNKTMKLVEANQTKMYNNLSDDGKQKLKDIIIAPTTIASLEKGDKEKVLMITGTSFTGEGDVITEANVSKAGEDGNFETVVKYLVETYPDYKIIYKGHPSWGILDDEKNGSRFMDPSRYNKIQVSETETRDITAVECEAFLNRRIEFLKENNIIVLPAQTPAEAIIWAAGDDLLLAGYDSSLYMNARKGSLVAFFEESIEGLSSLNQILYGVGGEYYDENIKYLTYEWCKDQLAK